MTGVQAVAGVQGVAHEPDMGAQVRTVHPVDSPFEFDPMRVEAYCQGLSGSTGHASHVNLWRLERMSCCWACKLWPFRLNLQVNSINLRHRLFWIIYPRNLLIAWRGMAYSLQNFQSPYWPLQLLLRTATILILTPSLLWSIEA